MGDEQSGDDSTGFRWSGYLAFLFLVFSGVGAALALFFGLFVAFLAALFFAGGLLCLYVGVLYYRRYALVRNTSTERVRSIALGLTELEGVCRPVDQQHPQPFDDGTCLYARWEIEEYTRSGDSRDWSTIDSGILSTPFYLEDETGRVPVSDPVDATVKISDANTQTDVVGSGSTPNAEIVSFCEQNGIRPESNNKRRYEQQLLTAGSETYVLGVAERLDDPGEYGGTTDLVITDGGDDYPFIVADRAEGELTDDYRNGAIGLLLFGLVTSAGALYVMLTELQQAGVL